ncbi:MAG: thioredoxin domain-containing protein [Acidimicrobiia bacterium]|nr:thioredoxin domain-containing protein [Acidimicrobiia bacterium]
MANRLAAETSPYLLQHKDNPVDWYPWGEAAFAKARAEDKPVFLSVGYAACHWCHVMERESFEDAATAADLAASFVAVKVDREERPDIDSIYMEATQAMTGRGGWPMSVFLTPDGAPFYAGTYYPPVDRPGMPSFRTVLAAVREAWAERRDGVVDQSAKVTAAIERGHAADFGTPDDDVLAEAVTAITTRWDGVNGGFVGAPKFPPAMVCELLLRTDALDGTTTGLALVETALDAMATRGLYDHLGGGFHRYCVDAHWGVPHFEKMLYDNALLVPVYLHAFQLSGTAAYETVACETLDYMARELRQRDGGLSSSQDADSEGVEGGFFVWTPGQLTEVLGASLGSRAARYYGVTDAGNFEDTGATVLHVADPTALEPDEVAAVRQRLFDARSLRVAPATDDKVLASWNGLALSAFAEAARMLGRDDYAAVATDLAGFLTTTMRPGQRIHHAWRAGVLRRECFAEDQAAVALGLVDLYETSFEPRWLGIARELADALVEDFGAADGSFYDTASDADGLVVRPRDLMDNATPAATSLAADLLARLGMHTGEARYSDAARAAADAGGRLLGPNASMFGRSLSVRALLAADPVEVAIAGPDPDRGPLLDVVRSAYRPFCAVAAGGRDSVPLLDGRGTVDGVAAAYVCHGHVCEAPVTTTGALAAALG